MSDYSDPMNLTLKEDNVLVERLCKDSLDNDLDGAIDCDDEDCLEDAECIIASIDLFVENTFLLCNDSVDNDNDTLIDCDDPDCSTLEHCFPRVENTFLLCSDSIDNDNDSIVDCADPDCSTMEHCLPRVENTFLLCNDNVDNDNDSTVDCADPDCTAMEHCLPLVENNKELCSDRVDNDFDQSIDCDDPDCSAIDHCLPRGENTSARCLDFVDNDKDDLVDCDDPDCKSFSFCLPDGENTYANCTDSLDNDGDSFIDCDDMDCSGISVCLPETENLTATCIDGIDNDDDGLIDCADDECSGLNVCLDYRCELATRADSCISINTDINTTYTLPSNIRAISENGLNMCIPQIPIFNTPIDIVFAIDWSGSMKKNDPTMLTPIAVVNALDTLAQKVPESNVGYFGFAAGVCNGQGESDTNTKEQPNKLLDSNHVKNLHETAMYTYDEFLDLRHCGEYDTTGTYFKPALIVAKEWSDIIATESPNRQIVVFFTDGEPWGEDLNALNKYIDKKDSSNYPELYYIGLANAKYDPMVKLANRTRGFYEALSGAAQIDSIFNKILQHAILSDKPKEIELKNSTTADSFITEDLPTYTSSPKIVQIKGSDISLTKGANSVSISALQNGKPTPYSADMTFNIKAPPQVATGRSPIKGTPFDAICYDPLEY
ncbi:MAG: hypothetical protein OCD01_18530 [Fibrobacterales bacterium]